MSKQLVQKSTMVNDTNNCTVLALKSVTGFTERKCYNLLKKEGRQDGKGFCIENYLGNSKKIDNVTFKKIYDIKLRWEKDQGPFTVRDTVTLDSFRKKLSKGIYYVAVRGHALAIINGDIVDNVTFRGGKRHVKMAWKVTGGNPNIETLEVKKASKRMPRLKGYDIIKYVGKKTYKNQFGKVILKPGDKRTSFYWHVDYRKRVHLNYSYKNGSKNYCGKLPIPREDFIIVGNVPLQDRTFKRTFV